MPANTINVTRPGKWGNPFVVVQHSDFFGVKDGDGNTIVEFATRAEAVIACVEMYKKWLPTAHWLFPSELMCKNLACFCKIGEPCHADYLLEVANR